MTTNQTGRVTGRSISDAMLSAGFNETAFTETAFDESENDDVTTEEHGSPAEPVADNDTIETADSIKADDSPDSDTDNDSGDAADRTGVRAALISGWRALVTWRPLPIALLVVAALLVAIGARLLVLAHDDRADGPMANRALVSMTDTQAVISQVSTALNQILSYDVAKPGPAQAAARHWLVGDAPAQYQTLVNALHKVAGGQGLTMVAKVSTAGVVSLRGDTAQLLVFVDQRSTRASDHVSSVSAAQVQISAVHTSAGWRIKEILPM